MDSQFLNFTLLPRREGAKTDIYLVQSKQSTIVLGEIKWYGPWRRYTFNAANNMLFDSNCLSDVVKFINNLMLKRKVEQQSKS